MFLKPRRPVLVSALALFLLAGTGALAKEQGKPALSPAGDGKNGPVMVNKYTACMNYTRTDPEKAFNMALAWSDTGTNDAAQHCLAASLLALGNYSEAATRFITLAQTVKANPDTKAKLLGNAAQAWLLAEKPEKAEAALTAGIKLDPANPNLYVDRARARAAQKLYQEAMEDLNTAIAQNPDDADAYTFRASARRRLEQFPAAMADITMALKLKPNHTEALLERGILYFDLGKNEKARADWLKVLEISPEGEAADAVRHNLEKMDVKKEPAPEAGQK